MSLLISYFAGATELRILQRDARDKVQWAATPELPGEQVKARIFRAAEELRIPQSTVKDAWYEQLGPYQYPTVHNAWLELVKRRTEQGTEEQKQLALLLYVNQRPIEPVTKAQAQLALTIAGLRRTG